MDLSNYRTVVDDAAEIYQPLNTGQDGQHQTREFRVLTLLPNHNNEVQIECTLKTVTLKEHVSYTAVSYTWGSVLNSREILVNGCPFSITFNLHNALKQFRDARNSISLWIDAICINQQNSMERDSQVQLMREIFSRADRTWLWLGEENNGSNRAIDLVERLSAIYLKSCKSWNTDPDYVDQSLWGRLEEHGTAQELLALHHLLARNYLYRVWVVQEIAVSSDVVMYCGERKFTWDEFVFAAYLLDKQAEYRELNQWLRPGLGYIKGIRSGIQRIMSIQSVRNDFQNASPDGRRDSLLFLLSNHRSTEATEPKDKYIAFAGLASEGYSPPELPYYDTSVSLCQVYTLATYHLAYETIATPHIKPLDFLDCAGQSSSGPWPSWVPNWSIPTGRATPLLYWQFAAKLDDGMLLLNATGRHPRQGSGLSFQQTNGHELLKANGFHLDTIRTTAFATEPEHITSDTEHKPATPFPSAEDLSDIIWRTCVLDRSHTNAQRAPSQWKDIFYQNLLHSDPSHELSILNSWYNQNKHFQIGGRSLEKIVEENQSNTQATTYGDTILQQFKIAFINAVGHRQLATTIQGHLCLVTRSVEAGDTVAILFDCSVPVVLRKCDSEQYDFFGTCYVHGIMHGEGVTRLDRQQFVIH